MFRRIDDAARDLHREWDSPDLLPRILRAIEDSPATPVSAPTPERRPLPLWLVVGYAAALVVISTLGLWVFRDSPDRNPFSGTAAGNAFLDDDALRDVEKTEAAYVASIDRLGGLVRARGPEPASALSEAYHERLLLIDSAIAECRAEIERNRYNAHLRRELLARYEEKKRTLEDLLKEVKS
jgi:hypothetical protein